MPPFPTNSLPAEFEEEHGTVDLDDDDDDLDLIDGSLGDVKPGEKTRESRSHYEVEDEDFDIKAAGNRVWLCKVRTLPHSTYMVPRFLMDRWSATSQAGLPLGRVRVYDQKDGVTGNPKIAVILDEPAPALIPHTIDNQVSSFSSSSTHRSSSTTMTRTASENTVPTEYKLTLQNTATKNIYVFGEKEEEVENSGEVGHRKRRRIAKLIGTVHHECLLTPSLSTLDATGAYRSIMRERQKKAAEPKRTVKRLDVDQATANRLASGVGLSGVKGRVSSSFVQTKNQRQNQNSHNKQNRDDNRTARIPRNELLDLLFDRFEQAPYWQLKALGEHVRQPQVYLREVLMDIAQLIPRGPYVGMWTLKDEYKTSRVGSGAMTVNKAEHDEDATGTRIGGSESAGSLGAKEYVKTEEDSVDDDDDDDDQEMVEVL